jgi:CRP/FNR family transcriptional regulator
MNIPAFLEHSGFFKELSIDGRKALAAICRPVKARRGETLFREGSEGERFFLLVSGRIRLHKTRPDGEEVVIKILAPGETFGEVVLFESPCYPVTAVALGESALLSVSRLEIKTLLAEASFREDFIAMLMRKQRYLAQRIGLLSTESVEGRFFHFLREHFGPTATIEVTLAKKEIAAAIGVTPETLSRLIARLTRRKAIAWKGRTLRILKPPKAG